MRPLSQLNRSLLQIYSQTSFTTASITSSDIHTIRPLSQLHQLLLQRCTQSDIFHSCIIRFFRYQHDQTSLTTLSFTSLHIHTIRPLSQLYHSLLYIYTQSDLFHNSIIHFFYIYTQSDLFHNSIIHFFIYTHNQTSSTTLPFTSLHIHTIRPLSQLYHSLLLHIHTIRPLSQPYFSVCKMYTHNQTSFTTVSFTSLDISAIRPLSQLYQYFYIYVQSLLGMSLHSLMINIEVYGRVT